MMHALLRSALLCALGLVPIIIAAGERDLPKNFQVDLIFPQPNTTYAPTQWFPIVFGIQNAQSLWPLPFILSVRIVQLTKPSEERRDWQFSQTAFRTSDIADPARAKPGNLLFHIPTINMTNGTTGDYQVEWFFEFQRRCFENRTEALKEIMESRPEDAYMKDNIWMFYGNRHWVRHRSTFSTAPDGLLPDIKAAAEKCQDYENTTTEAVRITAIDENYGVCPFLETNVTGSSCNYRLVAEELAMNTSALLLGKANCKDGDWRTLKGRCPKESNAESSVRVSASGWIFTTAIAFCTVWYNAGGI